MNKQKFEELREAKLTEEEFLILLILTPALSVAHSDGTYDEPEKRVMINIISNLINEVYPELTENEKENIIYEYLDDLDFIVQNPSIEQGLLMTLKEKTLDLPDLPDQINSLMNEIANASEGVSEIEKKKIAEITQLMSS